MKVVYYLLTLVLGAFGALAVIRVGERLIFGGGQGPIAVQGVIGVVALLIAWKLLEKARSS